MARERSILFLEFQHDFGQFNIPLVFTKEFGGPKHPHPFNAGALFAADGKSVNNVLAFPGLFKGAMEMQVRAINDQMLIAAAETLSLMAGPNALVPSPLDKEVHEKVAQAVADAA